MKKVLSVLLAVFMLFTIMPTAFAAVALPEYKAVHATEASAIDSGLDISSSVLRANANNALGAPDAQQNGAENAFASLRNFSEATYTFNNLEKNLQRIIVNYRGENADTKPDLSLIEVTWGTTWHVEAVDVYLLDARGTNGALIGAEYFIGTVYNKVGVNLGLVQPANGFNSTVELIGNHQHTHIFFPDNVESATGVKLVDATQAANEPTPTSTTYNAKDDGYDLDALTAWYVKEVPFTISGMASLEKSVLGQVVDFTVESFAFSLYAEIDIDGNPVAESYIASSATDEFGIAEFGDLTVGQSYYVFEDLTPEQALKYKPLVPYVVVTAVSEEDDEAVSYEFVNVLKETGDLTITKDLGDKIDDSVTGAGVDSTLSNNWFEYTELKPLAENPVQTFDLIAGRNRTIVGSFTVIYDIDTNQATVSYSLLNGLSYTGTANFSFKMGEGKTKGTDASLLNTVAPGQQTYQMSGNSMTVSLDQVTGKKGAVVSPAIPNDQNIIIYIHLGAVGYINQAGADEDTEFFVKVTGPHYPDGKVFAFSVNSPLVLTGIAAGEYAIEEVMDIDGTPIDYDWPFLVSYPQGSTVTIVDGGEATLTVKNTDRFWNE